jgi:hypothetical protein
VDDLTLDQRHEALAELDLLLFGVRDDDALIGKLLAADPDFAAYLLARLVRSPLRLH